MSDYKEGQNVLVRNEVRKNKNEDEYKVKAKVVKRLYGDVYKVVTEKGLETNRHASQLRALKEGDVGIKDSFTEKRGLIDL